MLLFIVNDVQKETMNVYKSFTNHSILLFPTYLVFIEIY